MAPGPSKYPLTVMYVEVNDTNFLNAGCYALQSPRSGPLVDVAIVFAANINRDEVHEDRAILHCNPQVLTVLQGHDLYIRPLQDKGIKVLLSVLGNHQGVGICNFQSIEAARDFACQLAEAVTKYGLDGVDFDDEYANYGDENGASSESDKEQSDLKKSDQDKSDQDKSDQAKSDMVHKSDKGKPTNAFSFLFLLRELRALLPTKIISLYYYGPVMKRLTYEDLIAGDFLDYSWNGDYGKYIVPEVPGLTIDRLGPGAVDLGVTCQEDGVTLAKKTVQDGYGTFLLYRLPNTDISAYLSSISEVLYSAKTELVSECLQNWPPTESSKEQD